MPGSDEQPGASCATGGAKLAEGFDDDALFGSMRAGGDDQWASILKLKSRRELRRQGMFGGARRLRVEFDVAGKDHPLGRGPPRAYALGVRLRLHQREVKVGDDASDE